MTTDEGIKRLQREAMRRLAMPDLPREDLIGINIRVSCSRPGCTSQRPCPDCLEIIGDAGTPCPHCGTLLKPKPGTDGQAVDLVDGAGQPHDCDQITEGEQ
jgi:hypothetical protein